MLEGLKPEPVWKYFEEYCAIPHPSGHEQAAAKFIVDVAARLKLPAITDATGNVLVRKNGTGAPKDKPPVIIQCHLDMVPQKNGDVRHDFLNDPIRPFIEGEWVKARGTTLGADNGIGVAIVCALLESRVIAHPPIEALFTVDEERGMTGALGLADDFLTGRRLINLDTEREDELCIGCAGGMDVIATLSVRKEAVTAGHSALSITVKGLKGGHSGMEIHLGRGNAIKILARLLAETFERSALHIVSLQGGSARNAIPREADAVITFPRREVPDFFAKAAEFEKKVSTELAAADPDFRLIVSEAEPRAGVIDSENSRRLVGALNDCPNGVLEMSRSMPGTVETSNNLAIVTAGADAFRIDCMLRSSSEQSLSDLQKRISGVFSGYGAQITAGGRYPAWQPSPKSALLAVMKEAYRSVDGKPPQTVTVHAGLECGIIGGRFPGMDMVSCGPTIRSAHSPDEQMHIPSVERFWKRLAAALERL